MWSPFAETARNLDGGITTRRYLVQDVEEAEAVVVVKQPRPSTSV